MNKKRKSLISVLAPVWLILGCDWLCPTCGDELPDARIGAEFRIAQVKVATEYDRPAAWSVDVMSFVWRPVDGSFMCNGVSANGCYSTRGTIEYNLHMPEVIRHESGHAILHRLHDSRWKCYEHTC